MTGPAKAKDLISQGIKDLEDLRSRPDLLSPAQQIGLALFADFETRIPRREVGQLFAKAKAVIGQLDDGYRAAVCGSYRSLFYLLLSESLHKNISNWRWISKNYIIVKVFVQFSVASFFWSVHFDFFRVNTLPS